MQQINFGAAAHGAHRAICMGQGQVALLAEHDVEVKFNRHMSRAEELESRGAEATFSL